jgi:hypothetical protein
VEKEMIPLWTGRKAKLAGSNRIPWKSDLSMDRLFHEEEDRRFILIRARPKDFSDKDRSTFPIRAT